MINNLTFEAGWLVVTLAENSQLITYYIKTSFSTNNREKSNELINQTKK